MPNRLAASASPYLLQHRDNPVDWYEWGEAAFAAARERDVPMLLSVGYSACHWCHVMAHESFEDPETADYMNAHFVNVKVDREERPDVDRIYMEAVQAMTGHGGWPMTAFLTPDGEPFFAGTYYPKVDRHGLPSFRRVLEAMNDVWRNRRREILSQASQVTAAIRQGLPASTDLPGAGHLVTAYETLKRNFDPVHGGFGAAPKFPQAPALEFLLRIADRDWAPSAPAMIETTLDRMARGGIYDHLGGGFSRYSVDAHWLVPHFEKMLYDNALLARIYLRGWQVTGADRFRRIAVETLDYIRRDLAHPDGGFFSAEDADSEGVEGKFYVWSWDEISEALGNDAGFVAAAFGVTPDGNFEGANILHRPHPIEDVAADHAIDPEAAAAILGSARDRLLELRSARVRPGLDDKVLTAWNGFALRALADAGAVLGEERFLAAARRNAAFVLGSLRRPDGRLLRSWRQGEASVPGFCEDYAAYAVGLFSLYQATGEAHWFEEARDLTGQMVELFGDSEGPGFFATGHDAEGLISRPKPLMDNPTPSDNSLAAEALLTLAAYTGDAASATRANDVFRAAGTILERFPTAAGHLLALRATMLDDPKEVAVIGPAGPERQALLDVVHARFRPEVALAVDDGREESPIPLLAGRVPHRGPPLAYVCRNFACDLPTGDSEVLESLLDPSPAASGQGVGTVRP